MRSRSVLVAAVACLLLTAAPSSSAAPAVQKLQFNGNVQLTSTTGGTGLSYPCLPLTGFLFTGKCPIVGSPNAMDFTFANTACAMVGTEAIVGPPAPIGLCTLGAAGTVSGWCGLADGNGVGSVTVTPLGGPPRTYNIIFNFSVSGSTVTGTGSVPGTATSAVTLAGELVPLPSTTGTSLGNSCTTKTAKNFSFSGTLGVTIGL